MAADETRVYCGVERLMGLKRGKNHLFKRNCLFDFIYKRIEQLEQLWWEFDYIPKQRFYTYLCSYPLDIDTEDLEWWANVLGKYHFEWFDPGTIEMRADCLMKVDFTQEIGFEKLKIMVWVEESDENVNYTESIVEWVV